MLRPLWLAVGAKAQSNLGPALGRRIHGRAFETYGQKVNRRNCAKRALGAVDGTTGKLRSAFHTIVAADRRGIWRELNDGACRNLTKQLRDGQLAERVDNLR